MRFKVVLVFGFLLIACLFMLFTKRRTFYTASQGKFITEKLFTLACEQLDGNSDGDKRLLVDFKFTRPYEEIELKSLHVVPVINGKDTLQLKSTDNLGRYLFTFPANGTEQLSLFVTYQIDSAGQLTNESKKYYNLDKINTYRFKAPF